MIVGDALGDALGAPVGTELGYPDGTTLLAIVGTSLGVPVGMPEGPSLGSPDGITLGTSVATDEGTWVSLIPVGLNEKVGLSVVGLSVVGLSVVGLSVGGDDAGACVGPAVSSSVNSVGRIDGTMTILWPGAPHPCHQSSSRGPLGSSSWLSAPPR